MNIIQGPRGHSVQECPEDEAMHYSVDREQHSIRLVECTLFVGAGPCRHGFRLDRIDKLPPAAEGWQVNREGTDIQVNPTPSPALWGG